MLNCIYWLWVSEVCWYPFHINGRISCVFFVCFWCSAIWGIEGHKHSMKLFLYPIMAPTCSQVGPSPVRCSKQVELFGSFIWDKKCFFRLLFIFHVLAEIFRLLRSVTWWHVTCLHQTIFQTLVWFRFCHLSQRFWNELQPVNSMSMIICKKQPQKTKQIY